MLDAAGAARPSPRRPQTAATQQGSLAPLFANLGVAAGSGSLPPALQQAVAQVLAQRTSLDQNLTGGDSRMRFRAPGCFWRPRWRPDRFAHGRMPDLKAALIVLRQTLSSLGATAAVGQSRQLQQRPRSRGADGDHPLTAHRRDTVSALDAGAVIGSRDRHAGNSAAASARARPPMISCNWIARPASCFRAMPRTDARIARAATIGAGLNLLQEALQEMPRQNGNASPGCAIAE